MKEEKKWDTFCDELNWTKYEVEGIAELRREYGNGSSRIEYYWENPDLAPVVAKGITAFLSFWSGGPFRSFRLLLYKKEKVDVESFFKRYYEDCLKFMSNEEEKNPFIKERKSANKLTLLHLDNEERLFIESKLIFDEVKEWERPTIEIIEKAALSYTKWVKEFYSKAKPILTFPEYLQINEREQLAKRLKEEFSTEKGKGIRLMIEALKVNKPSLLTIGNRQGKAIYTAIKTYFDRDIGSRQGVLDYKFDTKVDEIDLSAIKLKLDFILKSINSK